MSERWSQSLSTASESSTGTVTSTVPLTSPVTAAEVRLNENRKPSVRLTLKQCKKLSSLSEDSETSDTDSVNCASIKSFVSVKVFLGTIFVFLLFVIVLLIVVAILYATVNELQADAKSLNLSMKPNFNSTEEKTGKEICLSCSALTNVYMEGGIRVKDYFRVYDSGQRCCIEDLRDFLALIKIIAAKKYNNEVIRGNLCHHRPNQSPNGVNCSYAESRKPAAHLVRGSRTGQFRQEGHENKQLKAWLDDNDKGFRQGFGYEDGRLVIYTSGNYYIYSQVFFVEMFPRSSLKNNTQPTNTFQEDHKRDIWHAIIRYNEEYKNNPEETLLKSTQTKCWAQQKEFGLISNYLGAVLTLRAGDQLMVKVSNISLVNSQTTSTYFGAYMV